MRTPYLIALLALAALVLSGCKSARPTPVEPGFGPAPVVGPGPFSSR